MNGLGETGMTEGSPDVLSRKLEAQKYLEAQFQALRTEIIENKRQNFQIIAFGVASLPIGDFVATKFSRSFYIALPALVIVTALLYLGTNNAIIRCGAYIRRHIEPSTPIGWEQWLESEKDARSSDKTISIAIRLLFTAYLVIALLLAWRELMRVLVPSVALLLSMIYALISAIFAHRFVSSFLIHTPDEE
jgi:hypothetical protein